MADTLHKFTDQQRNTILAALRFYQEKGQGDPDNRSGDIHDIATHGGEEISLDADGIDQLCQDINLTDTPRLLVAVEGGVIQDIVTKDEVLLGLDVVVVDYDDDVEHDQNIFIRQDDGEIAHARTYDTGVQRQTVEILEDHGKCLKCKDIYPDKDLSPERHHGHDAYICVNCLKERMERPKPIGCGHCGKSHMPNDLAQVSVVVDGAEVYKSMCSPCIGALFSAGHSVTLLEKRKAP